MFRKEFQETATTIIQAYTVKLLSYFYKSISIKAQPLQTLQIKKISRIWKFYKNQNGKIHLLTKRMQNQTRLCTFSTVVCLSAC